MAEAQETHETSGVDPAIREEALALGWADKDQWRGAPEAWVDADTFVKKGREIVPMLRKNNERLLENTRKYEAEVARLAAELKATQTTVQAMETARQADVEAQVAAARAQLKADLASAARDGDHEAVADLTEQLTKLNTPAPKKEEPKVEQPAYQMPAEIQTWYSQNFEFTANARKMALANVVGEEVRKENPGLLGAAFLDEVRKRVDAELGGTKTSKTAGGNGGTRTGGGGGSTGKTYSDLPAEAKAACEKMASKLVGPNRAHKDIESWRKAYTATYFQGEE